MCKTPVFSVLVLLLLASFGVQAADTAELKVTGTIKPPACAPTFSGGGVVDFGTIPAKSLRPGQYTKLTPKQVDFSISCDSPAKVAMKISDNRASSMIAGIANVISTSSAPDAYNFGLGSVAGKNVGGYVLTLSSDSNADGKTTKKIFSRDGGTSWKLGAEEIRNSAIDLFSFGDNSNLPVSFKQLTVKIDVKVVLNKPENLPLTQDVPLDGSATVEMVYL